MQTGDALPCFLLTFGIKIMSIKWLLVTQRAVTLSLWNLRISVKHSSWVKRLICAQPWLRPELQYRWKWGNTLFIFIFMLPFGPIFREYDISFHCFADDLQIYVTIRSDTLAHWNMTVFTRWKYGQCIYFFILLKVKQRSSAFFLSLPPVFVISGPLNQSCLIHTTVRNSGFICYTFFTYN